MLDTSLTHEELLVRYKNCPRNGNWSKLRFLGQALYRATLWLIYPDGIFRLGTVR